MQNINLRDILELSNMFTTAAQLAKKTNTVDYKLDIDDETLLSFFKEAFPRKDIESLKKFLNDSKNIVDTDAKKV